MRNIISAHLSNSFLLPYRFLLLYSFLISGFISPNSAQAVPITFSGTNNLSIEILAFSTNLQLTAESTIFTPAIINGAANASQIFNVFGNPLSLNTGDIVSAFSSVSGNSPPDSDAYAQGAGRLTFTNTGNEIANISIRAFWDISVDTTAGADLSDLGQVQVTPFLLDSDGKELLNLGLGIFLSSSTAFGGGLFAEKGSNILNFIINPGNFLTLDFAALSFGQSSSTSVPEPSSFVIFLTGSIALLLLTKFKQAV